MTEEEKLTEEEYKLAEEVIKPIYRKAIQNDNSFAKYGINCYLAGLKAQRNWHDLQKDRSDYPNKEDMLIRVVLRNGEEYICKTYKYYLTEDEIGYRGYGSYSINFDSNGEWIDDNDVIAWCEIPKYTDKE